MSQELTTSPSPKKTKHIARGYQVDACSLFIAKAKINGKRKRHLIVLPTGTGKALVIAMISQMILEYPAARILMLTHSAELVQQNYDEFIAQFEDEEYAKSLASIYCAAAKQKSLAGRIIFASWQSLIRAKDLQYGFHLIFIDEAHRVGSATHYLRIIRENEAALPTAALLGLTATPHRTNSGLLTEKGKNNEEPLFDEIIFEKPMKFFIDNGFLVPLRGVKAAHFDDTGITIRNGDYAQEELASKFMTKTDAVDIVGNTAKQIVFYTKDRPNCAAYCTTVEHATRLAAELNLLMPNSAKVVVGTTANRKEILEDFFAGKFKFLCSVEVLTTGWNMPHLSAIAMVRATLSFTIYIQIGGRGMRISPHTNKKDCLYIDFGNNVERFGPFALAKPPAKKKKKQQEAPVKVCPKCQTYCHVRAKECENEACDHIFMKACRYSPCKGQMGLDEQICPVCTKFQVSRNVMQNSYFGDVMGLGENAPKDRIEKMYVNKMTLARHLGKSGNYSLRLDFKLSNQRELNEFAFDLTTKTEHVSQWFAIESGNFYSTKNFSKFWLGCGGHSPVPTKIDDAVSRAGELAHPAMLRIKIPADKKSFKEILEIIFKMEMADVA